MKHHNHSLTATRNFMRFFSNKLVTKIAKESRFLQRESKLEPQTFAKAFILGTISLDEISLGAIADCCSDFQEGLSITRQGVKDRLQAGSTFLKAMYEQTLANRFKSESKNLKYKGIFQSFDDIKVCDSTTFQIDESLAELYPGYGGNNGKSGLKIQAIYSPKYNKITNLDIMAQADCDRKYTPKAIEYVNKNELFLADLGYLHTQSLIDLDNKDAFFITKAKTNTCFYIKQNDTFEKIDILDLLKKSPDFLDTTLYVGGSKNVMLESRVIAKRLPDDIVNKRLREAKKTDKDHGRQTSERRKEMLSWIIILTNIKPDVLTPNSIYELYRLRWQIELFFKGLKSSFKIDKVKNIGKDYLECLLYGKLIAVLLATEFFSLLSIEYSNTDHEGISMLIFFKAFCKYANNLGVLLSSKAEISIVLLFQDLNKRCQREKRKRKTTNETLRDSLHVETDYQKIV